MKRVALAWAFVLACSTHDSSPTTTPGWHVSDAALHDPDGRTIVLRGMNLAGAHKNAPYFGFQQPADYARLRTDWGMNSVRFLITWAAVEPTRGNYDDAYLNELDKRIGWAEDADLLVIIDMHQDLYGEGFAGGDGAPKWTCDDQAYAAFKPATPWFLGYLDPNLQHCVDGLYKDQDLQSHFAESWRRVADKLVHHANVIGFDVLNEPYWGTYSMSGYEADLLAPLYEKVVAKVRSVAKSWVAFLEPGASRNLGLPTQLQPFSFPDVVYAPHSYDSDAESGKGFDAAHRDLMLQKLSSYASEARSLHAALWVGEYGGVASQPGIREYMRAQYDGAGAVAAGTEYWAYDKSDGYGFLNLDGTEKPDLAAEVVRPYPERVAGTLASYTYDEATKTLSFVMTADASVHAPTLVSLPPRLYPNGASIDCSGCAVTLTPTMASLAQIPPGTRTIVVRSK
jgi:endoglycosylceramidase